MANRKPNIVWIYCDELRADALGCYGHPSLQLHTPNIDRLADSGVLFSNNFCNSPVCVASRCSVLTGLYPEDTGVYNNEGAFPAFRLPQPLHTFPDEFSRNGYETANFGKLHVPREMAPDVFQHHNATGSEGNFWKILGEETLQVIRSPNGTINGGVYPDDQIYPPDAVTDNGLRWMENRNGPYLIRFSIQQPHTPVLPPARYVRLYENQDPGLPGPLPKTLSAFERRVAEIQDVFNMDPEQLVLTRIHYYAQVAWIDSQVGRIMEFLEQNGLIENTVIIFSSDHGNPVGDTGAYEKLTFTPTVHRVPLLISFPRTIPAAQVRGDICDSLDIGQTLFGLAGIDAPKSFKGRNLFRDPAPETIYSTIGYGQPSSRFAPLRGFGKWRGDRGWPRRSCVRTDCYRLDMNVLIDGEKPGADEQDVFLADVVADPLEFINLASEPKYAEVVCELSKRLAEHTEGSVEVASESLQR